MANVILTPEAIEDILEIYNYILEQDGEGRAETILNRLEKAAYSLAALPLRGKLPEDLAPFGNRKVREIQETPWRIFYRPEEKEIFVLRVFGGRRSVKEILEKHLLR